MTASSNGNIFRVTGHLCREFTAHRWIPRTKESDAELWCFCLICTWINGWVNNGRAGHLRCHCSHYEFTVMDYFEEVPGRVSADPDDVRFHKEKLFTFGLLERDPTVTPYRYATPFIRFGCRRSYLITKSYATWNKKAFEPIYICIVGKYGGHIE